jgi:hypothetical protein
MAFVGSYPARISAQQSCFFGEISLPVFVAKADSTEGGLAVRPAEAVVAARIVVAVQPLAVGEEQVQSAGTVEFSEELLDEGVVPVVDSLAGPQPSRFRFARCRKPRNERPGEIRLLKASPSSSHMGETARSGERNLWRLHEPVNRVAPLWRPDRSHAGG